MLPSNIQFVPAIVAVVCAMIFSFIYYSPQVAGDAWAAMTGVKQKAGDKNQQMMFYALAMLVMAVVMDMITSWAGATTWQSGAQVGLTVGVGLCAMTLASPAIWEKRPFKLWAINAVGMTCICVILGAVMAGWGADAPAWTNTISDAIPATR